MPLTAHLAELRSRLIKSLLALLLAFSICFTVVEEIFQMLTAPLHGLQIPGLVLIGTAVPEAFFTKIKVAFFAALVLAWPLLLWQGWQFVAPGLYEHERRYARFFVSFGTLFFLLGAVFCQQIVFPAKFPFLLSRYQAVTVQPGIANT